MTIGEIVQDFTDWCGEAFNTFATNLDEGELINAQEYLQIPAVVITVNPADINVKIKEPEQREIDRMLRKYEIEDVEAEEVKEEPVDNEII